MCEVDHVVIVQFVSLYGRKISSTQNIFAELKHFAASCVAGFLPSQHKIGVSRYAYNVVGAIPIVCLVPTLAPALMFPFERR